MVCAPLKWILATPGEWGKNGLKNGKNVGSLLTIYRGLSGPPGPKPRKSLKKVSRGLRPRAPPRVWKKSHRFSSQFALHGLRALEMHPRKSAQPITGTHPSTCLSQQQLTLPGRPSVKTKGTARVSLQEHLFTDSSKVSSCGFWQKRVRLSDLLEGGLTALQEPTLTVLLVLPK